MRSHFGLVSGNPTIKTSRAFRYSAIAMRVASSQEELAPAACCARLFWCPCLLPRSRFMEVGPQ